MGGGCLSPKPRIGEIYIDCINSIYQEVKKNQKISQSNIYEGLKDKILKKGLLRKLMDYLQCHRSMISEALLHNYRIMVQSKTIQSKLAGLIIVDYIISTILKKANLPQSSKVFYLLESNAYSTYQSSQIKKEYTLPNMSTLNKVHTSLIHYQQSSKQNQDPYLENLYNSKVQQSFSQMFKQIRNIKFHNIYFNMLKELIQEQQIYQYSIQSILVYGSINSNKSNLQQHITDIIKIIIQNIRRKNHILNSLKCYYILLQKLKDHNIQKQIFNIKLFFQLWDQAFSQSQRNIQELGQGYDIAKSKLIIEKIISKFISLSVGKNSCNQVYNVILSIYDENKFLNMQPFQDLLMSTTKNEDLKVKFFRGLYCQLLCYFSVCKSQEQNTLYAWSNLSVGKSLDTYVSSYNHPFYKQVKKHVMATLRRWFKDYNFVDINNIIRYNLYLFIYSFDFNILCSKDRQFNTLVAQQFCRMCLSANSSQKIMIINCMLQELRIVQKDTGHKLLSIQIIESLFQQRLNTSSGIEGNFDSEIQSSVIHFCPCEPQNQMIVNSKLFKLFTKIIRQYGILSKITQVDEISYFIYSIYQFVVNNSYSFQEYWKIMVDIRNFFLQIQKKNGELLILAFSQRIVKAQKIVSDKTNAVKIVYFLGILIDQVLNSNKLANRSKYRKTVNAIYNWTKKINQFKQQITDMNKEQINIYLSKAQQEICSQQSWINDIQLPERDQFSITNQDKVYQNASIVFRDMFQRGVSVINSKFKNSGDQIFKHSSVNNKTNCFSVGNSVIDVEDIGDQDKSLKDVMDMINI